MHTSTTTIANVPVFKVMPEGLPKGAMFVIHEVWGLTDHIKEVAERFAAEGYLAVAPDLLSETDIDAHATSQMQKDLFDPEKRNAIQPKLRELMAPLQTPEFAQQTSQKLASLFDALYDDPASGKKVGVVGYCFGGTYSYNLAVREPKLIAAVPYYGHADQPTEDLRQISAPILAFYGEKDERLMQALPDLEDRMHEASVNFTSQVYGGAGHAFFNDSNPFAYDKQAAQDAWRRTLEFLNNQFDAD